MNYIDTTLETAHSLYINTRLSDSDFEANTINWTLKADGNDTVISFSTPSANFVPTASSYYQELTVDLFTEGITLKDKTTYVLKGATAGEVIYLGKISTTSQDISNFSMNQGEYTPRVSTNDYLILE